MLSLLDRKNRKLLKKITLISVFLVIQNCFVISHNKSIKNSFNYIFDYEMYYKKFSDYFIGFGTAKSVKKKEAIKMSQLIALSDLTQTIKITVNSMNLLFNSENSGSSVDDYHRLIWVYSNIQIKQPQYRQLKLWKDSSGIYHSIVIALKRRDEYFNDYMTIFNDIFLSPKKIEKFKKSFNAYYDEFCKRKNKKIGNRGVK